MSNVICFDNLPLCSPSLPLEVIVLPKLNILYMYLNKKPMGFIGHLSKCSVAVAMYIKVHYI